MSVRRGRHGLPPEIAEQIEQVTGQAPAGAQPLAGGCIAEVLRVDLADGGSVVVKLADPAGSGLAAEARMLRFLAERTGLPVPRVLHGGDRLLLLEYLDCAGALDARAERHAAALLAELHGHTARSFGFDWDTPIGPLSQPNGWMGEWCAFFRERRLLPMGRQALDAGRLDSGTFAALERLCGKLERYIDGGTRPALIHGDVWGGNVLVRDGRIAAFIDPAIYFADPEIELAFATLFGTSNHA